MADPATELSTVSIIIRRDTLRQLLAGFKKGRPTKPGHWQDSYDRSTSRLSEFVAELATRGVTDFRDQPLRPCPKCGGNRATIADLQETGDSRCTECAR